MCKLSNQTMEKYTTFHTSNTLIRRAVDLDDDEAWDLLHRYYDKFIKYILHQLRIPACDIDDLSQQIYVRLTKYLKSYKPENGLFRNWLATTTKNEAYNYFNKKKKLSERQEAFEYEAQFGLGNGNDVEAFIDEEWKKYLAKMALELVKKKFKGKAIDVFEMDLAGKSADEISAKLGIPSTTIYTYRKRVKKSLLYELQALSANLEPS